MCQPLVGVCGTLSSVNWLPDVWISGDFLDYLNESIVKVPSRMARKD